MLCCLVGALLAGNIALAWRLLLAAARSGRSRTFRRVALACVLAIAPLGAAAAALAGNDRPDAPASQGLFDVLCLGAR